MTADVLARANAIAADRDRGAGELALELLPVLDDALAEGPDVTLAVARAVCRGQPAMAPLWHACAAAVREGEAPGAFARVRAEIARAPAAVARAASLALRDLLQGSDSPRIVTLSFSSSVQQTLGSVSSDRRLRVVCGEGRPRFEGRRLAVSLASPSVDVTLTSDAALASFLPDADAVVVGADAIAETFWINKVGTHALAAAATYSGVPVYVVASRDKAMPADLAAAWRSLPAPANEIWAEADPRIAVLNRYFEPTPIELATLFLTDAGPVSPGDLPAIVRQRAKSISDLFFKLN